MMDPLSSSSQSTPGKMPGREIDTSGVVSGTTAAILRNIQAVGVDLCIWKRPPLTTALPAVNALFHGSSSALPFDRVAPSFSDLLALVSASPDPAGARALATDLHDLIRLFGAITKRRHVRLRLECWDHDGCAKFHADSLRLRLLCTYAGPGTEWLDAENVRRDRLGDWSRSLEEANQAIVVDPARIHCTPAWHVLVFKGRHSENSGSAGLVHRSAPVSASGKRRLVLRLDLPESCSC